MIELAIAAAFFVILAAITLLRTRRPAPVEVRPMRAALERRMREGTEFTL
jgi:hypothetical protein